MTSPLPPPRRIVASNLAFDAGASEFTEPAVEVLDETLERVPMPGGMLVRAGVASNSTFPAKNDGSGSPEFAFGPGSGVVLPGGVNVYVMDLAPGLESPVHRTVSADYLVVQQGTPTFITPEGPFNVVDGKGTYQSVKETLCKPGDVIYQRGSMHAWANKTDQWIRMLAFIVDAEPQKVPTADGKATEPLGELWLARE